MLRFEEIKNDVSYIKFEEKVEFVKGLIINELDNHERNIDVEWIAVMLERLNKDMEQLDEIKSRKISALF